MLANEPFKLREQHIAEELWEKAEFTPGAKSIACRLELAMQAAYTINRMLQADRFRLDHFNEDMGARKAGITQPERLNGQEQNDLGIALDLLLADALNDCDRLRGGDGSVV